VDAPQSVPSVPTISPYGLDWPKVWAANVAQVTYPDANNKSQNQAGQFFYDFPNKRQAQVYGNKKLLFVSGKDGEPSRFSFIIGGTLCFYVGSKDSATGDDIGIPLPNFMKTCHDGGFAKYAGREKIVGEWADHYTCEVSLPTKNSNHTEVVAFQTWHNLGLADPSKVGLPMVLSSGDSLPNWQKPRLVTIWYNNITVGAEAIPEKVMEAPRICFPMPAKVLDAFKVESPSQMMKALENKDAREDAAAMLDKLHSSAAVLV
jgi:hypothetical protein